MKFLYGVSTCILFKYCAIQKKIQDKGRKVFFLIFCVSVKVSVKHGHLVNSMSVTFNFQLSINNCVIPLLDHTHTVFVIDHYGNVRMTSLRAIWLVANRCSWRNIDLLNGLGNPHRVTSPGQFKTVVKQSTLISATRPILVKQLLFA